MMGMIKRAVLALTLAATACAAVPGAAYAQVDPNTPIAIASQAQAAALRALPRQGLLLGAIGDSRIQQTVADSGKSWAFRSIIYWIGALTRGRLRFDPNLTDGVSGDTTVGCLSRLPALITKVKAASGDGILWLCATNDPPNSILPAATATNVTAAVNMIRSAGLLAFVIVETPRGYTGTALPYTAPAPLSLPSSEPLLGYHQQNIEMERRLRSIPGVITIDPVRRLADLTRTDGSPRQDLEGDGLHFWAPGSYYVGQAAAEVVNPLVAEPQVLINTTSDISKTGNIFGNFLFSGMVQGTGGTIGANSSGQLADNCSVSTSEANLTATLSKFTSTNSEGVPETWQQVVLGGSAPTGASPAVTITCPSTTAGPVPDGSILEAAAEVQVDAGAARIRSIDLVANGGGSNFTATGSLPGDNGDMLGVAWSGVLVTPRLTVPTGGLAAKTINFIINARQGYAASATIRFRRLTFRRIT